MNVNDDTLLLFQNRLREMREGCNPNGLWMFYSLTEYLTAECMNNVYPKFADFVHGSGFSRATVTRGIHRLKMAGMIKGTFKKGFMLNPEIVWMGKMDLRQRAIEIYRNNI